MFVSKATLVIKSFPVILRAVFAQFRSDCISGIIQILPLTDTVINRVENAFSSGFEWWVGRRSGTARRLSGSKRQASGTLRED